MNFDDRMAASTEAMERLTAALLANVAALNAQNAVTEVVKETKSRTRKPKDESAEAPITAALPHDLSTSTEDRWVHIPKYKTVAKLPAGDPFPSMESAVEVTEQEFKDWDATYKNMRPSLHAPLNGPTPEQTARVMAHVEAGNKSVAAPVATAAAPEIVFSSLLPQIVKMSEIKGVSKVGDTEMPTGRWHVLSLLQEFLPNVTADERRVQMLGAPGIDLVAVDKYVSKVLTDAGKPTPAADLFA